MRPRVINKVDIVQGFEIETAAVQGERVVLTMRRDGETGRHIKSDHVIAATGYRVDLSRLTFMDEKLRRRIRSVQTMPNDRLTSNSRVRGRLLYWACRRRNFRSSMRFIYGAEFAACTISQHLDGKR